MTTIIDVLKQEHRNIETLLLILEQELHIFMRGERPDFDILRSFVTYFLDYPDQCHHPKEDLIFSMLRKRNASMTKNIDEVMSEHENEASRLQRFANVVDSIEVEHEIQRKTFEDAVRDFTTYQRAHITKEEHILFPACLTSLQSEDWKAVESRMCSRSDPLFSGGKDQEFGQLHNRILQWAAENEAARGKA
jgi:hemerythrin-like domain-containing protein